MFWKTPFEPKRLTRWGTELHDRFMLPFWVWQDFEDVIADLNDAGFAFEKAWFAPHFEFRFPKIGDFETRAMTLTLRSALEPWHVMGEDATPGGTARYVDSSLERLEARVTGWNPERFVLTCNKVEVPLQPTGQRRRARRRHSLSRVAAAALPASAHRDARAARLRRRRHVEWPEPRRLRVPRRASRRSQPRDAAGQRARGRRTPSRALFPHRPHAGQGRGRTGAREPRVSVYTRPSPRVTLSSNLLGSYAPPPSRYDEMVDGARKPRPHWQAFLSQLSTLPAEALRERTQFVHDAIASDGVSYNVYADPKGASRPWELDLLPLILPAHEWQTIATAVAQRARLLNGVLNDLYGPQRLLAEGLLPPALVYGQRSFLAGDGDSCQRTISHSTSTPPISPAARTAIGGSSPTEPAVHPVRVTRSRIG